MAALLEIRPEALLPGLFLRVLAGHDRPGGEVEDGRVVAGEAAIGEQSGGTCGIDCLTGRVGKQRRQVLAGQHLSRELGGAIGFYARHGEHGGQQIDVAAERPALLAALDVGMHDMERQVIGLPVGERALAAQPVGTGHLAVIRGEDDDRVLVELQCFQLGEQRLDRAVHVPDAVEVVVVEALPARFVGLNVTQNMVPDPVELTVRPGATWRVERLPQIVGDGNVPGRLIELVLGRPGCLKAQLAGVLELFAGRVGVEVHDVVRVYEAHVHAPRLAVIAQRPALRAQPVDGAASRDVVEAVAAQRVADQVSGREIVGKSVFLHVRGHESVDRIGVEVPAQVPLALVGGVVACLAQHLAGGRRRQVAHPGHVEILEHAVVHGLQAGHDHRPGRGAHRRRALVVGEGRAGALEALVSGQRQARRPLVVKAFLVCEDEEDVQGPVAARNRGSGILGLGDLEGRGKQRGRRDGS